MENRDLFLLSHMIQTSPELNLFFSFPPSIFSFDQKIYIYYIDQASLGQSGSWQACQVLRGRPRLVAKAGQELGLPRASPAKSAMATQAAQRLVQEYAGAGSPSPPLERPTWTEDGSAGTVGS